MPRRAQGLSAAKVSTAAPGRYGDGAGLYLLVRSPEAKFWLFRYTRHGRMREMGLGAASGRDAVKLADARIKASALHRLVRNGIDPLEQRAVEAAAAKAEAQAQAARSITFKAVSRFYLDSHEAAWRNAVHRQQWSTTLATYADPVMGDLAVGDIGTAHVLQVLEPIWAKKPETASRVRGRIEAILDYAKTREWRNGENPARWKGHLANLLPARAKVRKVTHHAALPWREIGAFMGDVAQQEGIAALALRFAILAAARTGEVIGVKWSEIDWSEKAWTIPAGRMKAGRPHRVPLSDQALDLLRTVSKLRTAGVIDPFVFPGMKPARPLSNMAMLTLLRRMKREDLTVHGFRSTFRDWAAETGKPADLAEAALAHTVGDKTIQAYLRGDLFERRRRLMDQWAEFCAHAAPDESAGQIVPFRQAV